MCDIRKKKKDICSSVLEIRVNKFDISVTSKVPGRKLMIDASVLGRSSKSEATCAEL